MARILVIDDDETVRYAIRIVLESHGYSVEEAGDGSAGLDVLERSAWDLVILDIIMPRRGGLEILDEIKQRTPNLPVLAISGGARQGVEDYMAQARAGGADAVIAKPFGRTSLLREVEILLGSAVL